jgi:ArsR family transcriptional regulator
MKAASDDLSLKLRALSDPVRRRILGLLAQAGLSPGGQRPGMCAADIEHHIGLAQPTISHHLRILCEAGLVQGRKLGPWMWYSRDEDALHTLGSDVQAFCG